jgi:hypothetical protein
MMRRALRLGRSFAMMVAHAALDGAIAVMAAEERARERARRATVMLAMLKERTPRGSATRGGATRTPQATPASATTSTTPALVPPSSASETRLAPSEPPLVALDIEGLLAEIAHDDGCRARDGLASDHRACRAIDLVASFPLDRASIAVLEDTVIAPRRPACVQRAAVRALTSDRSPPAARALARMQNTARVRAEWSTDAETKAVAALFGS